MNETEDEKEYTMDLINKIKTDIHGILYREDLIYGYSKDVDTEEKQQIAIDNAFNDYFDNLVKSLKLEIKDLK